MLEKGLVQKSIMLILLLLFSYACSSSKAMIRTNQAVSEKNILTFINHSGEDALVKLVGPSRKLVEVPNRRERTVSIAGGEYQIYVRYGNGQGYRYARGEVFRIVDNPSGYTVARLTLHGVINGNYRTYRSSEDEFNR
jgi:uncharacterized protein YcfL